jgi:hypothetical protein
VASLVRVKAFWWSTAAWWTRQPEDRNGSVSLKIKQLEDCRSHTCPAALLERAGLTGLFVLGPPSVKIGAKQAAGKWMRHREKGVVK